MAHSKLPLRLLSLPSLAASVMVVALTGACTAPPTDDDAGDEADDAATEDDGESETGEPLGPTWHQDIAPMVHERCVGCHREGSIGPFVLDDYQAASTWAGLALEAMESKQMPPWGQDDANCEPRLPFLNDPRPTQEELDLFAAWVDAGTPEGDPALAAELPELPELGLANVDFDLPMQAPIEIEPGGDQFWCMVLDPGFTEDTYVEGFQILPGNDLIVHHALVYVDAFGQTDELVDENGRYDCFGDAGVDAALIAVWAPGVPPQELPEDTALKIPANAKLVMQIHYHPTGATEIDPGTALQMRQFDGVPGWVAEYGLPGNDDDADGNGLGLQPGPNDTTEDPEFRIPAGESNHTERMLISVPPTVNGKVINEVIVWSVGTHMHYLGVDARMSIDRLAPEANTGIDEECWIQTPYYNFEWQRGYNYDGALEDMPRVRPGDLIDIECTYDNSMNNPHLVEALAELGLSEPVDVYLGDETLDEMCLGVVGFAAPNDE